MSTLIKNALIANEGSLYKGAIFIENNFIKTIYKEAQLPTNIEELATEIIDAQGKLLMPGVIDDQVHFREPGLTHKGDIYTESRAAVSGGVTSFMDMPNNNPAATSINLLEDKYTIAAKKSIANYSFYFGATNDNQSELKHIDPKQICGIKVFMGSSTGNMLVDDTKALASIFAESPILVATHCEDELTVQQNTQLFKEKYGDNIPFKCHPQIRSEEACYRSSVKAVELAQRYGTRLHVLHLTTERELSLFRRSGVNDSYIPRITAEVCVHHLWFNDSDYDKQGSLIKCNPAIKTERDRLALTEAVKSGWIQVVATDHAPHTWDEKQNDYLKAPSGLPLVQHSLPAMLEMYHKGIFTLETIVARMCHGPATIFQVEKRGYIREGYYADLVLVDLNSQWTVNKENIAYKCGWSPFEGVSFQSKVTHTWVNGALVYKNGELNDSQLGMRLTFTR